MYMYKHTHTSKYSLAWTQLCSKKEQGQWGMGRFSTQSVEKCHACSKVKGQHPYHRDTWCPRWCSPPVTMGMTHTPSAYGSTRGRECSCLSPPALVEEAWNSVAVQTAWKLEPAYQYEDDAGQSDKMNKVPSLHIPMLAISQCPQ